MFSPDYETMKSDEAVEDFKKRIEHYKATYEPLSLETDEYETKLNFYFQWYQSLHSKKHHRLDASCGFYRPDAVCQQVVSSLLTSSSCIKSVNIRLVAT